MTCLRCGHTRDEHVFTELSTTHVCKECTCASFVGVGARYEAPWGSYEIYAVRGDRITLKEIGTHSYVPSTLAKLTADYKEVADVPHVATEHARATTSATSSRRKAGARRALPGHAGGMGDRPAGAARGGSKGPAQADGPVRAGDGVGVRGRDGDPGPPPDDLPPPVVAISDPLSAERDDPRRKGRGKKTKAAAITGMDSLFSRPVNPTATAIPLEVLPPPVVEVRHAAEPRPAEPVPKRDRHVDPDHDRAPAPPRCWIHPPLTLGAVPPGHSKVSWPGRLLQYWQPCVMPAFGDGSSGPHAWFICDSVEPHAYCDSCRETRGDFAPIPEVASIPADHPRAQVWAMWSWPRAAAADLGPIEEVAVPEVVDFARPKKPPNGRPPWEHDPRGAIWEWPNLKPRARMTLCEMYEERAAIMEYDGNMVRAEAEYRAYGHLLDLAQRHGLA